MVSAVMEEIPSDQSPRRKRRSSPKDLPKLRSLPTDVGGELVQLFKLLADETRLQVLFYLLQETELNVGTLCALLQQSQPAVSHHLALMRGAGLIDMRRDGKHNFYRIQTSKLAQCRSLLQGLVFGADASATAAQSWGDLVAGMSIKPTAAGIAQLNDAPSSGSPSSGAAAISPPPASFPAAPPDAAP